MASFNDLIFGNQRVVLTNDFVSIDVDATVQETHSSAGEYTQHSVESGAFITDHFIKQPDKVRLEIVISDDPLRIIAFSGAIQRLFSDADRKSNTIYNYLKSSFNDALLWTIGTTLTSYGDMVLTSISVPRTSSTRNGLFATLEFQQVSIVSSEVVDLSENAKAGVKDLSSKNKKQGKKVGSPATAEQSTRKSQLYNIFG